MVVYVSTAADFGNFGLLPLHNDCVLQHAEINVLS